MKTLAVLVLLLCVSTVLSVPVQMQHMSECPKSEVCPNHPEAKCWFDCWTSRGQRECSYHFYDANDKQITCWF